MLPKTATLSNQQASCFDKLLRHCCRCGPGLRRSWTARVKPRPHQQQWRSNIVKCYKLNDSFDNVECCRFWQQCCGFRQQCLTKFRPFDKVETNWTRSICFDFVERRKFCNRIVRHCCRLWHQSRILLRQSRTLLRQCCWCGRGVTTRVCMCVLQSHDDNKQCAPD